MLMKYRAPSLPLLTLLACLFELLTIETYAQGVNLDAKSRLAASSYMSDPEYYKMVYVWTVRKNAERQAAAVAAEPSQRRNSVDEKVRAAELFVDGEDASHNLLKLMTSPLAGRFSDVYGELFDRATNIPGNTPYVGLPEKAVAKGAEIFKALFDPNSPDHERAVSAVRRIKYDPAIPFENQDRIKRALENQSLQSNITEIRKILATGTISAREWKIIRENIFKATNLATEEATARALKLADEQNRQTQKGQLTRNKTIWTHLTDDEKSAYAADIASAQSHFLDTMSGFAALAKDPASAAGIHQVALVERSVGDVFAVSLKDSFAENPMAYINVYSALAVTVVNLMANAGKDNALPGLAQQLHELSKQIDELRREMHKRFDDLDYSVRSYFEQEIFAIREGKWAADESLRKISVLEKMLSELTIEMRYANRTLVLNNEVGAVNRCLRPGLHRDDAVYCRDYYGLMAATGSPLNIVRDPRVQLADLIDLTARLKQIDVNQTLSFRTHPLGWLDNSKKFIAVFELNPALAPIAREQRNKFTEWSLSAVIFTGENIRGELSDLLLKKTDSRYELKKNVLIGLLERYAEEARGAIAAGHEIARTSSAMGPSPFNESQDLPQNVEYSFFRHGIKFCEGSPGAIEAGSSNLGETGIGTASKEAFKAFDPDWFQMDKNFLPLVPRRALWATIMGGKRNLSDVADFGHVTVAPCWRKILFPYFIARDHYGIEIELQMELEIHVILERFKEQPVDAVVARYRYESPHIRDSFVASFDSGGCSPLYRLWTASSFCAHGSNRDIWKAAIGGINLVENFKSITVDPSPALVAFNEHFDRFESDRRRDAWRKLNIDYPRGAETGSRRALILALNLGLDPKQPHVEDLIEWLVTDAGLPDLHQLAESGMVAADPRIPLGLLEQRLGLARGKIERLEADKDLSPRIQEYSEVLANLRALSAAKGKTRQDRCWAHCGITRSLDVH